MRETRLFRRNTYGTGAGGHSHAAFLAIFIAIVIKIVMTVVITSGLVNLEQPNRVLPRHVRASRENASHPRAINKRFPKRVHGDDGSLVIS